MALFRGDNVADAALRARFAGWLAPLLGRQIDVDPLRERCPTGGGWSRRVTRAFVFRFRPCPFADC
jgi:hypothetical protein